MTLTSSSVTPRDGLRLQNELAHAVQQRIIFAGLQLEDERIVSIYRVVF